MYEIPYYTEQKINIVCFENAYNWPRINMLNAATAALVP